MIDTVQDFFYVGMDRRVANLAEPPQGPILNLAPGLQKKIHGTIGVGRDPGCEHYWEAPKPLPFPTASVAAVHVHHFLEHLTGEAALAVLYDIQEILLPGGVVYITVPYYNSSLQAHALDHKSFWNEDTWSWITNEYYDVDSRQWVMKVHFCMIIGIVERNLAMLTQLVKEVN